MGEGGGRESGDIPSMHTAFYLSIAFVFSHPIYVYSHYPVRTAMIAEIKV